MVCHGHVDLVAWTAFAETVQVRQATKDICQLLTEKLITIINVVLVNRYSPREVVWKLYLHSALYMYEISFFLPRFLRPGPELFWMGYFAVADSREFLRDVIESLRRDLKTRIPLPAQGQLVPLGPGQRPEIWSFAVSIDNDLHVEVPCASELNDEDFMQHVQWFRSLLKALSGPLGNLSLLSPGRVEIAEVSFRSRSWSLL